MTGDITDLRPVTKKLLSRMNLSADEIRQSFGLVLGEELSEASVAAFLVALTMKGETASEIGSIIDSIKARSIRISPKINGPLLDICGTGGNPIKIFNVSTAAAVVASAAGAKVAKHGNRSMSGLCGSADFLEHIGFDLDTPPSSVTASIENIGLGFLYAPKFHPRLAKVARLRKTIGIRTIFNTVGPLCNPCTNLSGQVVGVSETSLLDPISTAMANSYGSDTMVVHAHDGFDELSNTCENDIIRIVDGELRKTLLHPKEYGVQIGNLERLIIHDKEESVKFTIESVYGQSTKEKEDIVALNAAAALVVGKIAKDIGEGIEIARKAIKSGASRKKMYNFIKRSGNIYTLEDLERKFDL